MDPAELIERHGAVSAEVAEALAEGARERVGADVGIGVTGDRGAGTAAPRRSRSGWSGWRRPGRTDGQVARRASS